MKAPFFVEKTAINYQNSNLETKCGRSDNPIDIDGVETGSTASALSLGALLAELQMKHKFFAVIAQTKLKI